MPDFIFASQADIEAVEGEVSALEQNKQDLTEKVSAIEEADKANTDKYTSVKAVVDYVEPLKNSVSNGKTLVASAITNKGVTTAADASFDTMATNINSIKLGSGNATADKVLSPYTFTNSTGEEQTGTIPSKAAATITPGTTNKTISAGQYLSGTQTIAGDANLVAANIKSGVTIFGVTGNVKTQDSFFENITTITTFSAGSGSQNSVSSSTGFNGTIYTISVGDYNGSRNVGYSKLLARTNTAYDLSWIVFPFDGVLYYKTKNATSFTKTYFDVPTNATYANPISITLLDMSQGYLSLTYSKYSSNDLFVSYMTSDLGITAPTYSIY